MRSKIPVQVGLWTLPTPVSDLLGVRGKGGGRGIWCFGLNSWVPMGPTFIFRSRRRVLKSEDRCLEDGGGSVSRRRGRVTFVTRVLSWKKRIETTIRTNSPIRTPGS